MPFPTVRRKPTTTHRALSAAGTAGSATAKVVKARIAWLAGKRVAQVAAPAVAVGTVAVVARRRSSGGNDHAHDEPEAVSTVGANNGVPIVPAGMA